MKISKIFLLLRIIFIFFILMAVFCQLNAQDYVTLNLHENGILKHTARRAIFMQPGYLSIGTKGDLSNNYIDPTIVNNVGYNPVIDNTGINNKVINTSLQVGTITGSHSVSMTGAATYSIPIDIPSGTAGMVPSVVVTYSSQSGNGNLGMGWNVSGISAISRIGKDIYHDNEVDGVKFLTSDKFTLDGNRLLVSNSGVYGADGTTYSTEAETFSRITSYGSFGNGGTSAKWFKVEGKNGQTMEYGNSGDSYLDTDNGSDIITWLLNKTYDKYGNYVEYKYVKINREILLSEIHYTGNQNAGLAPYNFVRFQYDQRSDATTVFENGSTINKNCLLTKIVVSADGLAYKQYEFRYGQNNLYSFLNEVVEYGSDNTTINSTIIKYGDASLPFTEENVSIAQGQDVDLFTGDFNGDGLTDVLVANRVEDASGQVYHTGFNIYTRSSDGTTFNPTAYYSTTFPGTMRSKIFNKTLTTLYNNFQASDFNGDGIDDIIIAQTTQGSGYEYFNQIYIWQSATDGTKFTSSSIPGPGFNPTLNIVDPSGNSFQTGDFDGDGRADYFVIFGSPGINAGTSISISFPGRNIYNKSVINNTQIDLTKVRNFRIIDFDGDGKQDLFIVFDDRIEIYTFKKSNPSQDDGTMQLLKLYTGSYSNSNQFYFGDFNGDQKTDFLYQVKTSDGSLSNNWGIAYSNGLNYDYHIGFSFPNSGKYPNLTNGNDKVFIADFNGDGYSDILFGTNEYSADNHLVDSRFNFYYSKGGVNNFLYESLIETPMSGVAWSALDFAVGDFNGDGRADILNSFLLSSTGPWQLNRFKIWNFKPLATERFVDIIEDGFKNTVKFGYNLLTQKNGVFNSGLPSAYPLNSIQSAIWVVGSTFVSNGVGGTNLNYYGYQEAKIHKGGRGFLGFKKTSILETTTGITTTNEFEFNTSFYIQMLKRQTTSLNAVGFSSIGDIISDKYYFNNVTDLGNKRYWTNVTTTTENNNLTGSSSLTSNTYDAYGNITNNSVNVNSGLETTNTTTLYSQCGSWLPNFPYQTITTRTRAGSPSVSKQINRTCDAQLGTLLTVIDNSDKTEFTQETYGNFNKYGQALITTTTSPNLPTRTKSVQYDPKGRFAISSTNELLQTSYMDYDPRWSKVIKETAIDGLVTTMKYDGWGRLAQTNFSEGYSVQNIYGWDIQTGNGSSQTESDNSIFYTLLQHPGRPDVKTWFDPLGRIRKTAKEGFNNQWIYQVTSYARSGDVYTKTTPFYSGQNPVITTNAYDNYVRLVSSSNSAGTTQFAYVVSTNQLTATVTNPAGQVSSKTTDAAGKTVSTTDYGGTLTMTYDSYGNATKTSLAGVDLTVMVYDNYGRQTQLIDKNAGTTQYSYDAYGELKSQTDANGNRYNMLYDVIGRMTSRSGPEGTTNYSFVTSGNGINQPLSVLGFSPGISKSFVYDAFSRPIVETNLVDGKSFVTSYYYDTYGNATSIIYPSGVQFFKTYDANGYLNTIKTAATTLFTTTLMDAYGHYTKYSLGNGIQTTKNYDSYGYPTQIVAGNVQNLSLNFNVQTGNLTSRSEYGITETFNYDNLNRLTQSQVGSLTPLTMSYASNGNIMTKSDAGAYTYDPGKIHAVTEVSNPNLAISLFRQDISFTPFRQPSVIKENKDAANAFELDYTYAADYNRIKSVLKQNNAVIDTRYYFGDYEEDNNNGVTRQIHYLGGDGLNIIWVRTPNVADDVYYTHTDYLGSILKVTNSSGNIVAQQNFDPWGRNRNPGDWTYNNIPTLPVWLYRGFTGHEHLACFALINMNARLYDPLLGRMLGPDNYAGGGTQGINRYSYANNNPLKYVDPSGNLVFPSVLIGAVIGGIFNTVIQGFAGNIQSPGDALSAFGSGALAGALAGLGVPALSLPGAGTALYGGIAAGIASSFLPSLNFNVGLTSISISPAILYGSEGIGFGGNISGTLNLKGLQVGLSYGLTDYLEHNVTHQSFIEQRYSASYGYNDGTNAFLWNSTEFTGGKLDQRVGGAYLKLGEFSVSYENDWFFGKSNGDGGDRFRTTAARIGIKDFSVGLNLFTEDPGYLLKDRAYIPGTHDETCKGIYQTGTKYRLGALYVGYKNYRIGNNSERVRDFWQNEVAHDRGINFAQFLTLDRIDHLYLNYKTSNPYTTW